MKMKILIILTITLIIITSYCYGFVIFAESENDINDTLVTEVGSDINDILKYENYAVVRNEVNINVPGVYKVTYRHIKTEEENEKVVHVIDKNTKSYLYEELLYQESSLHGIYDISSIYILDNKPNCTFTYQGIENSFKHHFNGEIENKNHYANTITMYSKGNLVDSCVYNDIVHILTTNTDNMTGNKQICIYSKNSLNECTYKLNVSDFKTLTCIGSNDKYCFITGITNETSENFLGVRKGNDSFLLIYNLETETIENIIMFPLESDDEISDIVYYKGYLYLIQKNGPKSVRMLKLDIFGNVIKQTNIDLKYGYYNVMLKLIDDQLYLAYSKYDYETMDYIVEINTLNEDLESSKIYNDYIAGMKLIDFNIHNGIKFVLLNNIKNDTGFLYLLYDENNNLLGQYKSENNDYIKGLAANNVIIGTSNDKMSLKYYQINSLIKLEDGSSKIHYEKTKEENDFNLNSYKYLINGNYVSHSNLSKIDYNQNLFGYYEISYYFDDYFDYYQEKTIEVLPFVGSISNQTYDIGLTIKGNGMLYVDNLLIENEHTFIEPGKYQIKLVGKDNLTALFDITISDLSVKFDTEAEENTLEISEYYSNQNDNIQISKTFTESINVENNKKNSSFLYLIPAVTLGIAIIFIKRGI